MKKSLLILGVVSCIFVVINGCGDCTEAVEAEKKACDERIAAVTDSLNTAWQTKLGEAVKQALVSTQASIQQIEQKKETKIEQKGSGKIEVGKGKKGTEETKIEVGKGKKGTEAQKIKIGKGKKGIQN